MSGALGWAVAAVVVGDLVVALYIFFHVARAGRALDDRWQAQQAALETVRSSLARAVADADERASAFERLLSEREERLGQLLDRLSAQEDRLRAPAVGRPGHNGSASPAREAVRLADAGLGLAEIARRLEVDPAQVRVMLGLREERPNRPNPASATV